MKKELIFIDEETLTPEERETIADEAEGRDFDLILNISEIIQKNKGAGYERWAKRYNLKQTAKALCFTKERGINTLSELIDQTESITKCYNPLSDSLHKKQERLNEIDVLYKLTNTTNNVIFIYRCLCPLGISNFFTL